MILQWSSTSLIAKVSRSTIVHRLKHNYITLFCNSRTNFYWISVCFITRQANSTCWKSKKNKNEFLLGPRTISHSSRSNMLCWFNRSRSSIIVSSVVGSDVVIGSVWIYDLHRTRYLHGNRCSGMRAESWLSLTWMGTRPDCK